MGIGSECGPRYPPHADICNMRSLLRYSRNAHQYENISCESEMLALTVTENISYESEIAGKIEARVRKHTKKK
jgi:hypothetical protein